jgi:hypothetical protein
MWSAMLAAVALCGHDARGHGTPIRVSLSGDNQLTVANGVLDLEGFASMVFADPLEDSAFLSAPGDRLITDFPGFDINNVEPDHEIFLETWELPTRADAGVEGRVLWYWSPESNWVETAPNDQPLTLFSTRGFGQATLRQFAAPPAPLYIAEPLGTDLGQHKHLLYYILNDNPAAQQGAYGFFARLTSPAYGASDPFLIALNYGLDGDTFLQGSLAINLAALFSGDANRDRDVDLADFNILKSHFGQDDAAWGDGDFDGDSLVSLSDFNLLKSNFGAAEAVQVPEPPADALALAAGLIAVGHVLFGRRRAHGQGGHETGP